MKKVNKKLFSFCGFVNRIERVSSLLFMTNHREKMADINPSFSLYHLSLKQPSGSICSIVGNFSGSRKSQEIVRATQTALELWKFNKSNNELNQLLSQNTFSNISKISTFKYNGDSTSFSKDLILLTSDSGMLTIIEYDLFDNKFISITNESFYKTGIRRLSPCSYISVDPKGRAIMISALERNKLVYTFTKDNNYSNNFDVSSPIEANRNNLLTYDISALDVGGNENPVFAAIETEYGSKLSTRQDVKMLTYYEFDLGLNHVILSESEEIKYTSNHIVPIPGGFDGPSGILLCSEGMIQYKCPFKPTHYLPIPLRSQNDNNKSIIVSSVVHKMKNIFFVLLQNQFGDIFKLTLEYSTTQESENDLMLNKTGPGMVTSMKIRYFDTIPVCSSLIILKSGHLFADFEHSDKAVYEFEKLGDSENAKEWNSQDYNNETDVTNERLENIEFAVKNLDNIVLVTTNSNLNPLIDLKINHGDFINSLPELYSISGMGARSKLKILHKNIQLSEIVTQDLPSNILNSFTLKINKTDKFDKFIILSFFDGSIILKIGDEVEEAENSGFIDSIPTLNAFQIGKSSIVQIHATGLKQIFYNESDERTKSIDWNPPSGIEILKSACTNSQVILALTNGDVVYFEISELNDSLVEYSLHKEFNATITDICVGDIPDGRIRAPFIIVTCKDTGIHVLSTDPKNTLKTIFTTKLPTIATSIAVTSHQDKTDESDTIDYNENLVKGHDNRINYVHIGLQNGIYARYVLTNEGNLENVTTKFIVNSRLNLYPIKMTNKLGKVTTLLTINSTLSFIVIPDFKSNNIKLIPLPIPEKFIEVEEREEDDNEDQEEFIPYAKNYGCIVSLHSEDVPQGLILTHGNRLTIASMPIFNGIDTFKNNEQDCENYIINSLNNLNNIENIQLRYTPRAICDSLNREYKISYIACSDSSISTIFHKSDDQAAENDEIVTYGGIEDDDDLSTQFEKLQQIGYPTRYGNYGSCIHVYSTEKSAIGQTIEILNNEIAIKIASATLEYNGEVGDYVLVSTIENFNPLSTSNAKFTNCYVRIYRVEEDGSLEYLYKTSFKNPILSIHAFQGCVVFGFGDEVGMYQLGKLQLLRKAGLKLSKYGINEITDLKSSGFRLFLSDIRSSVMLLIYDSLKSSFVPILQDYQNRHITRSLILDNDTVLVGDKFGTLAILRCPDENFDNILQIQNNSKNLKFENLMNFYVGDLITSLSLEKLGNNNEDVIVYSGINGTIGTLTAMKTVKEVNFFKELEKLIINALNGLNVEQHELTSKKSSKMLIDRDIMKFRSYYIPKRACIDGDLIEVYFKLESSLKHEIAQLMDRTIEQIETRIIEMRNRIGY